MGIEALIFDVDGTLAETEELHRQAFNATFAECELEPRGWHWDQATYAVLLKTTGGKERLAEYLRAHLKVDPAAHAALIASLHEAKTRTFVRLLATDGISLRPHIAHILARARAHGLKLAVATTTSAPNVEALCQACFQQPAATVFDVIACGDEVRAKKPAPDVFNLALERLGLKANQAIAFEDSLNGLKAAKAAGLVTIVSPSLYTRHEDLHAADMLCPEFDDTWENYCR